MNRNETIREYRVEAGIGWVRLSKAMNIKHPILYRTLTNKTKPHETTDRKIQRWYTKNRAVIEATLGRKVEQ